MGEVNAGKKITLINGIQYAMQNLPYIHVSLVATLSKYKILLQDTIPKLY